MRERLKEMGVNRRYVFYGTFSSYAYRKTKSGELQTTILFRKITDENGNQVAGHIWMDEVSVFRYFKFRSGDIVQFEATIRRYEKGRRRKNENSEMPVLSEDYELVNPRNVCLMWRRGSRELLRCYEELE